MKQRCSCLSEDMTQSILTIKRKETKTHVKGDASRVPPLRQTHTHTPTLTLTWESQLSVSSNYLKEWIHWNVSKASVNDSDIYYPPLSSHTHTQPSVRPMRRGLLHQGLYLVLAFLVTTPTARPVPGCYTWFQVGVMWPLCSWCSKRTYVTGFTSIHAFAHW